MTHAAIAKQAVVVGAGMGGLTVARVLAERFERVIVLERDTLPAEAVFRVGTPQARHVHLLLPGGQRALCELFPDFDRDLARAGAVPIRTGLDLRWESPGHDPLPQRDVGLLSHAMSRPLIERTVRERVQQFANVTIHQRCRVRGFATSPDATAVTEVCFDDAEGRSASVGADLVVDSSGNGAPTLALLKSAGWPVPEETTIGVDIGYSTAVFAIPDDAPPSWKGVMTLPDAPQSWRGCLMLPMEGNRWIATLGGRFDDKPPAEIDEFLCYAKNLRTPTIFNAIRNAPLVGEVHRYVFATSFRRHFERLTSFPRNLLPFGDVICRFNPVYGQGMSVAAQEACLLDRLLAKRSTTDDWQRGLVSEFFVEAQSLTETPWAIAANLDFVYPQTKGERPPLFESWIKFQPALLQLAAADPSAHRLMLEVQGLLRPRSAYSAPEFLQRLRPFLGEKKPTPRRDVT